MAAGNLDDPLSDIPNVVLVDQSAATAAPGAGYVRVEAVNGVLGIRVGSGAWVPLASLSTGLLSSLTEKETPAAGDWLLLQDEEDSSALKKLDVGNLPGGEGSFAPDYVGNTTPGGQWERPTNLRGYAVPFTLATGKTLLSVGFYSKSDLNHLALHNVGVCVDDGGEPGMSIAGGGYGGSYSVFPDNVGQWFDLPVCAKLAAGDYWLVYVSNCGVGDHYLDYTDGGSSKYTNIAGLWLPYITATWSSIARTYSLRALVG